MGNRFVFLVGVGLAVLAAQPVDADVHFWHLEEVYTDSSGDIQFVELGTTDNGQDRFKTNNNTRIVSNDSTGTLTQTYFFPNDLSSILTANKKVLIGTSNLGSIGGVSPDFVLPADFIYDGGRLRLISDFWGTFQDLSFTAGELPDDGTQSMLNNHGIKTLGANSPTNFSGVTGSVPEPASAAMLAVGGMTLLRRRVL